MTFNLRGGNPRELCHDLRSEILDERRAPRAPRRSAPISDEMVLGMERDEDETVEGRGGKEWRRNQIRKITDKVFDHFKNENGTANLRFEDVYIGVLLVYNDINKRLPGPHFDPPSKDSIRLLIQVYRTCSVVIARVCLLSLLHLYWGIDCTSSYFKVHHRKKDN
ncbi:hypothetical protein ACLB2K_072626 [Fragaria x ananassa]